VREGVRENSQFRSNQLEIEILVLEFPFASNQGTIRFESNNV